MRHLVPSLLSPLLLVAFAAAQVTPLAFSRGITLQVGISAPVVSPPGDVPAAGFGLWSTTSFGDAGFQAVHGAGSEAVELAWSLAARAVTGGAVRADAAVRYELWAAQPVQGQLQITWTPACSGSGMAHCAIDLGDDGSIDASGASWLPVAFGPGMLAVRIDAGASATAGVHLGPFGVRYPYQGAAAATLRVRLVPTHGAAVEVGGGCGDPLLTATGNLLGGFDLHGAFAPGAGLGIAVLGFDARSVALPLPPHCSLHTTPLAHLLAPVVQQQAGWSLALPPALPRPFACTVQLLGLDLATLQATSSRALAVTCR